jgi:hypothetical protein
LCFWVWRLDSVSFSHILDHGLDRFRFNSI